MDTPIHIYPADPQLKTLHFHPYRNKLERHAVQFMPKPGEQQTIQITTPWGETLNCKAGDFIVNEIDSPGDQWVVDKEIFLDTYQHITQDRYVKSPLTYLALLTDLAGIDPDSVVIVHSMEGPVTVRAGDYYLAIGTKGEIWPYPKDKADNILDAEES